jgi:N-methylhydantoinase B
MAQLDALDLQVIWNRLIALVEEQAQTLLRTAFSPIVRECGDLSAGVFDPQGRMLAQAVTGTPGHVNAMAASVGHFLHRFPLESMEEGDVYVTNDPWFGSGHRNDFVVCTPVFRGGRVVAIFSCTAHLTDLGGLGFSPEGTDVFMEALGVPFLKLFDAGVLNETLMAFVKENSRLPIECEGDIYSLANCNEMAGRRLLATMDEFKLKTLESVSDHILKSSRDAVLAKLAKLPKGEWSAQMTIDGYDAPVLLAATLKIGDSTITVDYAGTAGQVQKGINCPLIYATAYTVYGLASALFSDIPNNAGSLSVFEVVAPAGSIVNAKRPAAVQCRHVVGQMLPDVVFGCVVQALPDAVPAEGASCLWNATFQGSPGDPFVVTFFTNGGTGARPAKDGLSATAYPSGVKSAPIEVLEATTPLLFWAKEFRPGSGGAGRWNGGHGLRIEIENRSRGNVTLKTSLDRIQNPARGRLGGNDGAPGRLSVAGQERGGMGVNTIEPGQRVLMETPGGGGFGPASKRSSEASEQDRRYGLRL